MESQLLPTFSCQEVKHSLIGPTKTYRCEGLTLSDSFILLRHVLQAPAAAGTLNLPSGTISFGCFWSHRSYNVYAWFDPKGNSLGYYFNISDSTTISKEKLEWRDLVVDVLVLPCGHTEVLDENEIPSNLPLDVQRTIDASKAEIQANKTQVIAEVQNVVRRYGMRV